jgi:hypothetical protein
MPTPYERRREAERRDPDSTPGPGHETYDEQLERYREKWNEEFDQAIEQDYEQL